MTAAKIKVGPLDLEVEYDVIPAQNGGMTDPSWPEHVDITKVVWDGKDITPIIDSFSPSFYEDIHESLEKFRNEERAP